MDLRFSWTTHRSDGGCCIESVRSVLDLGIDPRQCTVFVQRGKPLLEKERKTLEDLNVLIKIGTYTRRNTYFDVVSKFQSIVRTGGDLCWNIDSDMIINDLSSAKAVFESDFVAGACSWEGCEFSGCSVLMKPYAAKICVEDLLNKNTPNLPIPGVQDDTMMGATLDSLFGRNKVLRWSHKNLGWYKFEKNWSDLFKTKWVHFGQKDLACKVGGGRLFQDVIKEHMSSYREWKITNSK